MRSHNKVLVCALLLVSLILQSAIIAPAMEITPFNTYTSALYAGLSISSGSATVSGSVVGSSSSYSISGTLVLQQYKNGAWAAYKIWPKATGTGSLAISKTSTVASGYKYRTKFTSVVNGESISKYSSEKTA